MSLRMTAIGAIAAGVLAYACSSSGSSDDSTTRTPDPPGPAATSSGDPGTTTSSSSGSTSGSVGKKNPIEGIAPAKAILQTDAFTDGPVWHAAQAALFFTTPLGDGAIYHIHDGVTTMVRAGSKADGTTPIASAVLATGDLVTVDAKRVVRTKLGGDAGATEPTVVAASYTAEGGVAAFDTLNDVVARKDGTLYVTDPGYFSEPIANRLYRISPSGTLSVVESFDEVPRPNGLALSPDEKILYVSFTQPLQGVAPRIRKYPVLADGSLGVAQPFVDISPGDSSPDGLTVDTDGNVYVATKTGIQVFTGDGSKIGTVAIPEQPTGLAFGGSDMKSLYVTTQGTRLWELRVAVVGTAQ